MRKDVERHTIIRPTIAALRAHDGHAVCRCFVHAIAEGAAAVLLARIEEQTNRHRIDDRSTAADVIAVGN
jgi:glycine/D-amino acid oxidase-like deaminating enzyme